MENNSESDYDVVIAGGSFAGLSAAMALGRALRRVLIIDGGRPCNRQTPHSHNFITHDGEPPGEIAAKAKAQVLRYPTVAFMKDRVADAKRKGNAFTIRTASEKTFRAGKLLFATGVRDIMPDLPGFAECWGISVIHCPFCHGYEFAGEPTGILANGETAVMMAKLLRNWTGDLTVYTNGPPEFDGAALTPGVRVNDKEIRGLEHEDGYLRVVRFRDGSGDSPAALYARPDFEQHSDLPARLGCAHTEQGYIQVDQMQKTSVPGVYAAGDNTTMFRAVSFATAAGTAAGAAINHELIDEGVYSTGMLAAP